MTKKGLAVFDLDGTITSKDTFLEFIRFVHGSVKLYTGLLLHLPFIGLFYLRLYPNNRLKEKIFHYFFKNYSTNQLNNLGVTFSREILPKICFSKALKRLEWHQQQGHHIVILTASAEIWLQAWCKAHHFDLIATVYKIKNERFTGKIQGKNCYGKEKVFRLQQQYNLQEYSLTYGYGDSPSDWHFLKIVDKPYYQNNY